MTEEAKTARTGPLSGLRILDFSRILSGPYATLILADLGAEVIKVEAIERGDDTRGFPPFKGPFSHYFIALNRGKKSLALDLKSPRGVVLAKALAVTADVVVENFRPGVMDRLGLGYEVLAADNPKLCYCSITGFGEGSPLRDQPAFDVIAQALSGVMSVNREIGGTPNRLGIPMGDMAGSIFAVFGILAALVQRQSTGKGQRVDVSMLDGLIGMLGYLAQIYFVTGKAPEPVGSKHPSIVPYGGFPTSDGQVIVACLTERFWHNFADALDLPELKADPRFAEYSARLANRDELERLIGERMRQQDTAHWLERLDRYDVPNAPVLDIGQALEQPHAKARGLVGTTFHPAAGEMRFVGTPLRFAGEAVASDAPPPLLGEQSAELLKGIVGLDDAEIADLIGSAVVFQG